MTQNQKNLDEFLFRLQDLIQFAKNNTFKGSTQAARALTKVRNLSVFK